MHFGSRWKCAESIFISAKVELKCFCQLHCDECCYEIPPLLPQPRECGAGVAAPYGQTGVYAEHLVPLEEFAAASQL